MQYNNKSTFLALACCLIFASSCRQLSFSEDQPTISGITAFNHGQGGAMDENGNCLGEGERYTFSLKMANEDDAEGAGIPAGMQYRVFLGATPPFALGEQCLCRLEHYTLKFDYLPTASMIQIKSSTGRSIPFSGPFFDPQGTEAYLEISSAYLRREIFIGFNVGTSALPVLRETGGLCIVDNISGPVGGNVQTEPHSEPVFDPALGLEYPGLFIPVEATDGIVF